MNPQLQSMLQQAIQAFQSGNFDSADLILKKVLQVDSKNLPALHVLGLINASQAKYREAAHFLERAANLNPNDASIQYNLAKALSDSGRQKDSIIHHKKAVQLAPSNPDAWLNYGKAVSDLGRYDEAITYYEKSLDLNPNYVQANLNKAATLSELGRHEEALEFVQRALNINPNLTEAWLNKGAVLKELKRYDEAVAHYDQALSLRSDYPEAFFNKGNALHILSRYDEAIAAYDNALILNPNYHEAWTNKGLTLHALSRYDEAIAAYDKALILNPNYHEAWANKGAALHELKSYDEAIIHYDKALNLRPDYVESWANKGLSLHELKRYDEAIIHYDKALDLRTNHHEVWTNKGLALHELRRLDEALTHYDYALNLRPDYPEASWGKSVTLLLKGDYENGFPLYESRWKSKKLSETAGKRSFNEPTWLGIEPLQGKTILLYGEQGLGDFIQFCRYTKLVSDLGAKVILETPESLAGLMEGLEGVSKLVIKGKELPFFNYQCPLLSLPLAFNSSLSSIPADIPYLTVSPNRVAQWGLKLGEKRKKRIGLVWSSMSNFKDDSKRSLKLKDFVRALLPDGFEYICLQKELKECDREFLKAYKDIKFFGDELIDFSDTAALINNLDLVISTCTSIPHLSGALGKKTLLLLSNVPDWRWLLDRDSSSWYPSIKLYRQAAIGDWSSVLDKVKVDLNSI